MKKKLLSALMVLCMALCLLPAAALAAEGTKNGFADGKASELLQGTSSDSLCTPLSLTTQEGRSGNVTNYDIYIADEDGNAVQITSANCGDVLGDGTVSFEYDEANGKGILTLNGASIVFDDPENFDCESPIDAAGVENLEIVLKGKNTIESTWAICVVAVNLTFSGTGSIDISTKEESNWPVDCMGAVTVNSGDVKISAVNYALCLDGALTVNGGSLELISNDKAISAGFEDPVIVLGENMVMRTSASPDGSDAKETAVDDMGAITGARYIKIAAKPAPAAAGNYYYHRTDAPQPSPKTADAGLPGLWCTLLLGSGAALPAVTLRRRKTGER